MTYTLIPSYFDYVYIDFVSLLTWKVWTKSSHNKWEWVYMCCGGHICSWHIYGKNMWSRYCSWLCFTKYMHQCCVNMPIQMKGSFDLFLQCGSHILWYMLITWNVVCKVYEQSSWPHGWSWWLHIWHIHTNTSPIYIPLRCAIYLKCDEHIYQKA